MNTMIIDGVNVTDYNLYLLKIPPIVKPPRRVRRITIPGKSGYLTEWSGDYEAYVKEPELLYVGTALADALDFLCSAKLVTFGNESTYAYEVRADEQVEAIMGKAGEYTIKVAYMTQPLKRLAAETPLVEETSYNVINPGNEPAYPKLVITGAGVKTVTIGTQTITISFATLGETITIDALNGQIYDDDGNNAWNKVTGDFPMIPVSASAITISTTASALTVYPNWRWS